MVYTEVKQKNREKYYYRVKSVRDEKKVKKKRVYLGKNLSKRELALTEREADNKLNIKKKKKQSEALDRIIPKIKRILKKHKVKRAGIFGSFARGEQKRNSDIDILVEPPEGIGLEFVSIQLELEEKLGKKVHLVTYKYIHPRVKKYILSDEVKII